MTTFLVSSLFFTPPFIREGDKGGRLPKKNLKGEGWVNNPKYRADDEKVKMYYTMPMPPDSFTEETVEIAPLIHHG